MALIAQFEGSLRITEEADQRITEDGFDRVLPNPNIGVGTLTANAALIPFAGNLLVKNSGTFQVPITFGNIGGTYFLAERGYIKDQGIWKRVF